MDILEEKGEKQIAIRSKLIDDLIVLIMKLRAENHEVVLNIDANEPFDSGKQRSRKTDLNDQTRRFNRIYSRVKQHPKHASTRYKKNRLHIHTSQDI